MPSNRKKVKSLISTSIEIASTTMGEAIGVLAGVPVGGGLVGVIISRTLSDFADRFLSKREKIRIDITAGFAIAKIKSRLDAGFKTRDDGFFDDKQGKRSDAEEIFEGVLLKAKNEHEEKKAKIIGNIFANIAFLQGFSVGEANHLLQISQNLTYRGMCILSLIKRKDQIQDVKLRENSYKGERISHEIISILQEAYQIYNLGLIACKSSEDYSEDYEALLECADVAPNRSLLTPMGERYYEVMGLEDIPEEDIKEVAKHLS